MESLQNEISLFKQLNNIFLTKFNNFSQIQLSITPIVTFSANGRISLPFKIKGRLITAGKYKDPELGEFMLPAEELKKTVPKWRGTKIFSSHKIYQDIISGKEPSIKEVLGILTNAEWNEIAEGIDFYGDIYDEDIARKINAGLINAISAGFSRELEFVMNDMSHQHEYYVKHIEPAEASIVFNPRDTNALFQPI